MWEKESEYTKGTFKTHWSRKKNDHVTPARYVNCENLSYKAVLETCCL